MTSEQETAGSINVLKQQISELLSLDKKIQELKVTTNNLSNQMINLSQTQYNNKNLNV
jgi:hypothetical protein